MTANNQPRTLSQSLWNQPVRHDASHLMAMQTPAAYVLAAGILLINTVVGYAAGGVLNPWLYALAMLVQAIAALILLAAPGDPMRKGWALLLMVLPTLAVAIAIPGLAELPGLAYAALSGSQAVLLSMLAVRGRIGLTWLGYLLSVAVALSANHLVGPLPLLTSSLLPNCAVCIMATVFAAIVRPQARKIYELRGRTAQQAAIEASEKASLAVRDSQMAYLNDTARPLLDRIEEGVPLGSDTVTECQLVEASLRDRIRAAGLDSPEIVDAARDARKRGVRVLLLDDRLPGSDAAAHEVPSAIYEAAELTLREAPESAAVTVRLLPGAREALATIAVVQDSGASLTVFDRAGNLAD